jgi:hypothetical protein
VPKIYVYKITADDGIAPCAQDGVLTLGVCKPAIRRTASVEDYLIGVGSNNWYPGRLIYVAQVSESIPGQRYYQLGGAYIKRRDCIYRAMPKGGFRWLNHQGRRVHDPKSKGMAGQMKRDVGNCRGRSNAVILACDRFVYLGRDTAHLSDRIWKKYPHMLRRFSRLQQSHLVHHSDSLKKRLLVFSESILKRLGPNSELDRPHDVPTRWTCHDKTQKDPRCSHACAPANLAKR